MYVAAIASLSYWTFGESTLKLSINMLLALGNKAAAVQMSAKCVWEFERCSSVQRKQMLLDLSG